MLPLGIMLPNLTGLPLSAACMVLCRPLSRGRQSQSSGVPAQRSPHQSKVWPLHPTRPGGGMLQGSREQLSDETTANAEM